MSDESIFILGVIVVAAWAMRNSGNFFSTIWGFVAGAFLFTTPFLTFHYFPNDFFSVFPFVFLAAIIIIKVIT